MRPKLAGNVLVFCCRRSASPLAALSGPLRRPPHSPHSFPFPSHSGPTSSQLSSTQLQLIVGQQQISRNAFEISRRFCSSTSSHGSERELSADGERRRMSSQFDTMTKRRIKISEQETLTVRITDSKKGHRFFFIYRVYKSGDDTKQLKFFDGPKIHVPEDAYKFVQALDKLIAAMAEAGEGNSQHSNSKPSARGFPAENVIASEIFDGLLRIFTLQLFSYKNDIHYYCRISQFTKEEEPRGNWEFYFPASILIELRMVMAKLLRDFDGSLI